MENCPRNKGYTIVDGHAIARRRNKQKDLVINICFNIIFRTLA